MSSKSLRDAYDSNLYLSEMSNDKFKSAYEDYLIDQLVFFRGVELQEISLGTDPQRVTRTTILNIIELLGG